MRLVKHTFYNLMGMGLPLIVAVFSIPILIRELGDARFGLLTLIWAVVGYFSLFDFGLGRALTQKLSVALVSEERSRIGSLVTTALLLMCATGILGGGLLAISARWGVSYINSVPNVSETVNSVYWMATAVPFIVLTSGFRGILEAHHAFGIINAIRLPVGILTFLGPTAVVLYTPWGLEGIAAVLVVGRIIACVVHGWYSFRINSKISRPSSFSAYWLKPLCISGGWMTLSNLISPLMSYMDRFVIGAVVSAAAVAYYTTPLEMVTKLWILPAAVTGVLFPAFAAKLMTDRLGTKTLFNHINIILYTTLLPITAFLAVFSTEVMSAWLGAEFASKSSIFLEIFSVGMLINCMAYLPFTLIQSADRPKIIALIHIVELPLYVIALWLMGKAYGSVGAAYAWLGRIVIDAVLMHIASAPILKWKSSLSIITPALKYSIITAITFAGIFIHTLELKLLSMGIGVLWLVTLCVVSANNIGARSNASSV